jgi:hypothetical protein
MTDRKDKTPPGGDVFKLDEDTKIKAKTKDVKRPPATIKFTPITGGSLEVSGARGTHNDNVQLYGSKNIGEYVEGDWWEFIFSMEMKDTLMYLRPFVQDREYLCHQRLEGKNSSVTLISTAPKETDPLSQPEKQEKREKAVEKAKENMGKTQQQIIDDEKAQKEAKKKGIAYTASFIINMTRTMFEEHTATVVDPTNIPPTRMPLGSTEASRLPPGGYKIDIEITGEDIATAFITFPGEGRFIRRIPMRGKFEYKKDKEIDIEVKKELPVWGLWTDNEKRPAMPKILKDFEDKKVDSYSNNKWLNLIKGKKISYPEGTKTPFDPTNEPNTYEIVNITKNSVTYEKGDIWIGFSRWEFRPTQRYRFPRDPNYPEKLYSHSLENYAQLMIKTYMSLKYHEISDTLTTQGGQFFGTLYRVGDKK